jgi:cytochrome c oxidase cbb3-type subunit 3
VLTACLACAACERPPSADSLREWTPGDHHSADDDKLQAGAQAAAAPRGAQGASETAQLVEITWRQQCSTCHGPMGRGDGQMGPMVQAPDLTAPDWQSKVTDEQIASTIKSGKNKMPKFDLPDPVLQGLVLRIRSLRGN